MAHKQQAQFIRAVRRKFFSKFIGVNVVDIGSMDINGNNRRFFFFSNYVGVDIAEGKNVDIVGKGHEVLFDMCYDGLNVLLPNISTTLISTECLEHDYYWKKTLNSMYDFLRPGELLVITAAGDGRKEHGTAANSPTCSPHTNDYYQNISNEMFQSVLKPSMFSTYFLRQHKTDLQFYGIKK